MIERTLLLATELGERLHRAGWRLSTAESCTGGGVASAITAVPGSSAWFEFGFVTYANRAKQALLGVDEAVLAEHGAVSEPVVRQMAAGALRVSGAELALSISGIAGPGGGSADKPLGLVWFGCALSDGTVSAEHLVFHGDRDGVRRQAVDHALQLALDALKTHGY